MKKIILFLALAAVTFPQLAHAQSDAALGVSTVGTVTDTAKPNTTKSQIIKVMSHDKGITVQYFMHKLTDTLTGYASVWVSIDNITYAPHPTLDSVAITAASDLKKIWFVNTKENGNPINFIDVRTRCVSNTTNATGKGKITTKCLPY